MTRLTLVGGLVSALILTGCFNTVRSTATLDAQKVANLETFDYGPWNTLLKTHVNDVGQVNYDALKADRAALDAFVALMAAVGPKSRPALFDTREKQLAYYINAYNALTMFNVINRLPAMKSVMDDKNDFFYFTEFTLDGTPISLYKLENDLIRPTFNEPRIHFALNCASVGCPVLPAEAFLPETLDAQLERETQKFLHETRNVSVDANKTVTLSKIFEWYAVDFPPSPVEWIRAKAPDISLPAAGDPAMKISHRPYDWALNVQPK